MANGYTFRHGQRVIRTLRVDSGTVIETDDMLFLDSDDVKPASSLTWDTNLATTQATFANTFMGIAMHESASGDTDPVDVDVSPDSHYEYTVASGTFEVGDDFGPDEDSGAASPGALLDQVLEAVSADTSAVARAAEYKASASTSLLVTFASAYFPGSGNINADVG